MLLRVRNQFVVELGQRHLGVACIKELEDVVARHLAPRLEALLLGRRRPLLGPVVQRLQVRPLRGPHERRLQRRHLGVLRPVDRARRAAADGAVDAELVELALLEFDEELAWSRAGFIGVGELGASLGALHRRDPGLEELDQRAAIDRRGLRRRRRRPVVRRAADLDLDDLARLGIGGNLEPKNVATSRVDALTVLSVIACDTVECETRRRGRPGA
mmetsp:Transcript_13272/g.53233  ORF Transcript_13272/g.53233 Transcript_13272/m.53233 type:complete len:216 (+) Transcript_13272:1685-2332(+)